MTDKANAIKRIQKASIIIGSLSESDYVEYDTGLKLILELINKELEESTEIIERELKNVE